MIVSIQPSAFTGVVQAPASKSSMQRACAAALLSKGVTTIINPGHSNDDNAALDVITKLGASIVSQSGDRVVVQSSGVNPASGAINCGESGLGIRMFTPLAALTGRELTINGTGSLLTRPMHFFDEVFPSLGISIKSNGGHLPLVIQGPLRTANIEIDGSLSSQFLTGLLMAFAAAGPGESSIRVQNLKSRPYIDLTLDVMRQFGVAVEHEDYHTFRFPAGSAQFTPTTYTVEGDWSGGAFLLVAGAIAGPVTVKGLDIRSTQADKAIVTALERCGATISGTAGGLVCGPEDLHAFEFDATDCPDLFPPLVALAAYCSGTSVLTGVNRLAHKESNRGLTLQEEFRKMGIPVELDGDRMTIQGGPVQGAHVHSRHDHRIAMACGVAALRAHGETVISEAEAINKSFPDFFAKLSSSGVALSITEARPALH